MIVEPKIRGFICTTAHPAGCREHVRRMFAEADQSVLPIPVRNALVIGATTGYGLATRIALAVGGAATLGVGLERESDGRRTATAGWYNSQAFVAAARERGRLAVNLNGDAFSRATKQEVVRILREQFGPLDLLIYSLAAPRRTDEDGRIWTSAIKPVGEAYTTKTLDLNTHEVREITLEPASADEIDGTIKVMGGEDWRAWVTLLGDAGLLAPGALTLAYSYIGPELTVPIYRDGTIGLAKQDIYRTAREINATSGKTGIRACVAVNKAVVTQASAAIPSVPLYLSILYRVMKEEGSHEDYAAQMRRLITDRLFASAGPVVDTNGWIRLDDWEMDPRIQHRVNILWEQINSDNVRGLTDIDGYWSDFYALFGFGLDGVDYARDIDPVTGWQ